MLGRVDEALASLGARTTYVFLRSRLDAVPQPAIAREIGISLSAVEKHLKKANRAIRALLDHRAASETAGRASASMQVPKR